MDTRSYSPVNPAEIATFRKLCADNGVTVPDGNTGQITAKGGDLIIDFNYDGTQVLILNIVKNDLFMVWDSTVWQEIEKSLPPDVTATPIPS
jgi:hypothetical protein